MNKNKAENNNGKGQVMPPSNPNVFELDFGRLVRDEISEANS